MTVGAEQTSSPHWQAALNPQLTQRLLRPLAHPAVSRTQLASSILTRVQRMADRFPLMAHLSQRQRRVEGMATTAVPLVLCAIQHHHWGGWGSSRVLWGDLTPTGSTASINCGPGPVCPTCIPTAFCGRLNEQS